MSLLKSVWKLWLRFSEILGNIMMTVWLTLIYFTLFLIIAIPFKIFSDPLSLRTERRGNWVKRVPMHSILESMKKQG